MKYLRCLQDFKNLSRLVIQKNFADSTKGLVITEVKEIISIYDFFLICKNVHFLLKAWLDRELLLIK